MTHEPKQGSRVPSPARGPDWVAWTLLLVGMPLLVAGLVFDVAALNVVGFVAGGAGLGMVVSRVVYRRLKPDDA